MLRKTSLNTSLLMSVFLVAMVCSIGSGGTIYGVATAPPIHATNPNPADGAEDVPIDANLAWTRGDGALWEYVYFGTDPCHANLPLVDTLQVGVVDPLFDPPGDLVASTTYYWQIVEVNAPNEYQGPVWSFSTIPGEAQCDYPEDGALIPGDPYPPNPNMLYTELIYIPGPTVVKHTGYFSKVRDEVANRAEVAKIPTPWIPYPGYKYIVGGSGHFPYESLIRGQFYYWTVDATDSFGNVFSGDVWEFTIQDFYAYVPSPVDGANNVDPNVLLSWLEGYGAQNHDVYLGTNLEDVNNAYFRFPVHDSSPEYQGTTDAGVLSWQMNGLDPETRYYWRIDEVQGRFPPSVGLIYKGDVWSFTTVGGEAQCQYPEDGAVIPGDPYPPDPSILYTELIFIPGPTAVKHTGYLSKVRDKVANRAEDANLGPPPLASYPGYEYKYFAGHPNFYPHEGLIQGTKYYWTVDETDVLGNVYSGDVWEFAVQDYYASLPNPPNEATFVETDVLLCWSGPVGAQEYDVYIGTDWNDVNDAPFPDPYLPPFPVFLGTVSGSCIQVTGLAFGTKYYWRVDAIQGRFPPSPGTVYKGDVWSFTTVGGEAQCDYPEDGAVIPGYPYPPDPSILYTELIFIPGPTAVKHTGYLSKVRDKVANRVEDANLGPPPLAGYPGYEYKYFAGNPNFYPYEGLIQGTRYYWTVDETDALGNVYSGGVWEFAVQDYYASLPNPPNEATFVETDVLLCWLPGWGVCCHRVYIGTSWDDVNNVDAADTTGIYKGYTWEPFYQCSNLAFNTKYYWRIDEVSPRSCMPPLCAGHYYKGDVWCFTTVPHWIFVDVDAAGANDGTSWADAYNYLQDALADANSSAKPVEICVAEGVYKPDHGKNQHLEDQYASFQLQNLVTIKGGYGGIGEPDPNARDIAAYVTILSGEISDDEDSCHVVTGSWTDRTAVLDGFTITEGEAYNVSNNNDLGGGMYSYAGSPTIRNCTFTNNWARNYGGGMCNDGDSCPLLINCIFVQNSATDGGGMDNEYSHPILINCVFAGNWVDEYNADEFSGGAIYNFYSNPTLINCTITANAAMRWGECGGIYNSTSSRPTLNNCILSENSDTNGKTESSQIFGGTPLMNYCCVQGWTGVLGGSGNMGEDPCFAKPSYWEDPCGTPENPWDDVWIEGDYHLLPDSPCIDVGYNNAPNLPATDLDGHPRIIDGDCNDTDVVDMGAYEFNYAYIGDFDYNCEIDFVDFSIFGLAWTSQPGDLNWDPICNIAIPVDSLIDWRDAAIICDNWLVELP